LLTVVQPDGVPSEVSLFPDTPFSDREAWEFGVQFLRGGRASRAAMAHATGSARKIRIAVE